jgi:hypothetical protein
VDGLLPINQLDVKLICPSIFGGRVVRPLTAKEVMDCLDVPEEHRAEFAQATPDQYQSLPFVNAVPTKALACMFDSFAPDLLQDPPTLQKEAAGYVKPVDLPSDDALTLNPRVVLSGVRQKAAKDDGASIELEFWDGPFGEMLLEMGRPVSFLEVLLSTTIGRQKTNLLDVLRDFALRIWRRSVFKSFCRVMKGEHGPRWTQAQHPDLDAGRDCLTQSAQATFWEWSRGSRLFFWRWPQESRRWARDGHPVLISGVLPCYRKLQPPKQDTSIKIEVREKLEKFRSRGYIAPGTVRSLINYFAVPKGDTDLRLVFDGTKSGLNAALWAPSFHLPTVDSLLPALTSGSWQGDIDIAEMF